jgi:hypothetical protein
VQVKGKYPTGEKSDKAAYGYVGELTQTHPEMVLAIPYFPSQAPEMPTCVAYMPLSVIRKHSRGFRCQPATYKNGHPRPRRDYSKFFDANGTALLEWIEWKDMMVVDDSC